MTTKKRKYGMTFTKPSRTKQSFKDECDVNLIMKKYEKTNLITHVKKIAGNYGDFSNVTDYQTSMNAVMDANDRFAGLPSAIRAHFKNDPQNLIEFVTNPQNYEKAHELGLLSENASKAYKESKKKLSEPALPIKAVPPTL